MKRIAGPLFVLCAALMVSGCGGSGKKKLSRMAFSNNLTAAEMEAGILTPEVIWKIGRVGGSSLSPDGTTVIYTVTSYDMAENKGSTDLWTCDIDGGNNRLIREKASSPKWSGDGQWIYFMSDKSGTTQVWRCITNGSRVTQVTDIKGGIEDYGVSAAGNSLFYVQRVKVEDRASAEIHTDLPMSKALIYDDLMERHWDHWNDGSYLHIFVARMGSGKVTEGKDILPKEPWDAPMSPYYDGSEIAWNPDGTILAYTCKKLTGTDYATSTDSDIFLYDMGTGQTRNVTEGMPGYDKYPVFSPDGTKLAFTSMERPVNESDKERLFVMDLATGEKKYLTENFDYNASNLIWDGSEVIYFIAPFRGTYQIFRTNLEGNITDSAMLKHAVTIGQHDINSFSMASGNIIAERTSLKYPTELVRVDKNAMNMTRITNVNSEIYDSIKMGDVQTRHVSTTDGKEMLVWVVVPPDFDPSKKYPALLYCQGGPQSTVSQFWSYRWNAQLMAAQGYVVVMPNRRGVPSFGQEWLDQISGDYSGQNIRDYLSAIDDVSKEPWVDSDRLGCVGASYGGYSAYFLAGHHEGRFKAFIAHCGMFNMESMFGSTEELWFPLNDLKGPYWSDDPTAQRSYANSPHKFVKNWDTPILILVGLNDFRVPYTESLQAFTAARLNGIPSRLVAFENEAHQVFKPQNSLVWNREFFGWLDKYVKNPEQK